MAARRPVQEKTFNQTRASHINIIPGNDLSPFNIPTPEGVAAAMEAYRDLTESQDSEIPFDSPMSITQNLAKYIHLELRGIYGPAAVRAATLNPSETDQVINLPLKDAEAMVNKYLEELQAIKAQVTKELNEILAEINHATKIKNKFPKHPEE